MTKKTKELNRVNRGLDKKLKEENRQVMTDMICYIRGSYVPEYKQEVIWNDLLNMVLDAQERGESIEKVIGSDYKGFCDQVIENLPPRSRKNRVAAALDLAALCTSILGAINLILSTEMIHFIKNLFAGGGLSFQITLTWGGLLQYVGVMGVCFLLVHFVMKKSFELTTAEKRPGNRGKRFAVGGAVGLAAILFFLLCSRLEAYPIVSVNMFVMLCIVVGLYLVHKILNSRDWDGE